MENTSARAVTGMERHPDIMELRQVRASRGQPGRSADRRPGLPDRAVPGHPAMGGRLQREAQPGRQRRLS